MTMEGRASCPSSREKMPGAPSILFGDYYFFGLKSRDAEFMQ